MEQIEEVRLHFVHLNKHKQLTRLGLVQYVCGQDLLRTFYHSPIVGLTTEAKMSKGDQSHLYSINHCDMSENRDVFGKSFTVKPEGLEGVFIKKTYNKTVASSSSFWFCFRFAS